jgi:glutamate carboxypeptidase
VNRDSGRTPLVLPPEAARPPDDQADGLRPFAARNGCPEADERVVAWLALPVPGPSPSDGDLDLDHRFESVDIGPLEQPNLDESHGPGRITSDGPPHRLLGMKSVPTAASSVAADELDDLRGRVSASEPDFLRDLNRLVNIDCGSYTKRGVDEVGRWTAGFLERLGGRVEVHPNESLGDTVVATFDGASTGARASPRVLLIGHMDTVFDEGTAADRPFSIEAGIARGPGVSDMKAGLLAGLYALWALLGADSAKQLPFERLTFIANPDEEIGSPISTPIIREHARAADACLVLECARANGDIVSSRKGIIDTRLTVHGRAAHAGVEPEKGRSALLAAALLVPELHGLTGRWPGVTCNVGVLAGGTRPNVVPEEARLEIDLRATTREHLEAAEQEVRALIARPAVPDVSIEMETMARWWPMEKLERSGRLVDLAKALSERLGFALNDAATGGASDANTTAGMGIPSLDGLGPIGGNDHSPQEYLEVDSIVPRTTLLAGLLLAIARDPLIAAWRATAATD